MSDELEQITAAEAIELADGSSILLDVREQWEWDRVHAPNATLIPLGELESRVDELPSDTTIVVICHSGARSMVAANALHNAGHATINVADGMVGWQLAGGPVVRPAAPDTLG
jgi:rhodanese-related sulfurtransferase